MNFFFLVAKTIFYSLAALVGKILFCHRVISSIYCTGIHKNDQMRITLVMKA